MYIDKDQNIKVSSSIRRSIPVDNPVVPLNRDNLSKITHSIINTLSTNLGIVFYTLEPLYDCLGLNSDLDLYNEWLDYIGVWKHNRKIQNAYILTSGVVYRDGDNCSDIVYSMVKERFDEFKAWLGSLEFVVNDAIYRVGNTKLDSNGIVYFIPLCDSKEIRFRMSPDMECVRF